MWNIYEVDCVLRKREKIGCEPHDIARKIAKEKSEGWAVNEKVRHIIFNENIELFENDSDFETMIVKVD